LASKVIFKKYAQSEYIEPQQPIFLLPLDSAR